MALWQSPLLTPVDELHTAPITFIIDVDRTRHVLLQDEDTDGNEQITADDTGPKVSLANQARNLELTTI